MSSSLLMHESLQEYPIVMHVAHTFLLLFVSILRRHRYRQQQLQAPVSVGHQPSAAASDKAKTQQKMKVSSEVKLEPKIWYGTELVRSSQEPRAEWSLGTRFAQVFF